jgi:hypothetical protein
MSGDIGGGGIVMLTDSDREADGTTDWWCRHHKGNVAYLATRIKQLVDNPDDEEYREFFYTHFATTINDFMKSVYPVFDPVTREIREWKE